MSKFESALDELIINRIIYVEESKLNDPEHIKLSLKHSELYDEILKHLPTDKHDLLNDFASNEAALSTLESKHSYEQGLKDGIQMKSFLGLTS